MSGPDSGTQAGTGENVLVRPGRAWSPAVGLASTQGLGRTLDLLVRRVAGRLPQRVGALVRATVLDAAQRVRQQRRGDVMK